MIDTRNVGHRRHGVQMEAHEMKTRSLVRGLIRDDGSLSRFGRGRREEGGGGGLVLAIEAIKCVIIRNRRLGTGARRRKFIRLGPQSKSLSSIAPSRVAGLSTVIENYAVPRDDSGIRNGVWARSPSTLGISSPTSPALCSSSLCLPHWLRLFQEEYPIVDRNSSSLAEETRDTIFRGISSNSIRV